MRIKRIALYAALIGALASTPFILPKDKTEGESAIEPTNEEYDEEEMRLKMEPWTPEAALTHTKKLKKFG